jgi:hypothetical protein
MALFARTPRGICRDRAVAGFEMDDHPLTWILLRIIIELSDPVPSTAGAWNERLAEESGRNDRRAKGRQRNSHTAV